MLIDFTVENFRSFADTQTFSMIASKDASHETHVVEKGAFRFLKTAAVYGANASGKSNLIKAFWFMKRFVEESATKMNLDDPIADVEPFRLSRQWRTKPSTFAIRLLINGTEYQYGFSATRERVHKEWLHVKREGGRVVPALSREYDAGKDKTEWHTRGELKEQAKAAIKATRDNGLFLSQAAQVNVEFVKELFLWFRRCLWHYDLSNLDVRLLLGQTATLALYNQSLGAQIERLTRDADLGISRLALTTERVPLEDDRVVFPRLKTAHVDQGSGEPIEFSLLEEESNGTRRFFAIVGPIVVALDRGDLLVLDELDCSIHPLLTRKLIELFQSNEANPNGAQLIFATHDSTLMNASLLRRDQIWLCEKNSKEATDLFSLCDIERTPRKREALENNYLAGRYGGVPRFGPALEDYEVR